MSFLPSGDVHFRSRFVRTRSHVEEERERRMEFVPDKSEVDTDMIQVDPDTKEMLKELDAMLEEFDKLVPCETNPPVIVDGVPQDGVWTKSFGWCVEPYSYCNVKFTMRRRKDHPQTFQESVVVRKNFINNMRESSYCGSV